MGKHSASISLLFSKLPRRLPGLTSPSDGRITINSPFAFTSYELRRNLGFNPGMFGAKTSYCSSAPSPKEKSFSYNIVGPIALP